MSPSSVGPSSNKKSKDKSSISRSQSQRPAGDKKSISRSQSQRPAGDQDRVPLRVTAALSKVAEAEAAVKAASGLSQGSHTDPKTQPEPTGEIDVTNTQNTISGPIACEDMSPSGGSIAALQPETCDKQGGTQASADLNSEDTSSPPLSQGKDQMQAHEDDGLESGPVPEPKQKAESGELTEGADKGKQNSDSIYW